MKIVHSGFIYESVIGFIKDDRLLVDISKITPTQYTQINNRLKGEGYDVRGASDIKKILESYKKEIIDGVEYTRIGGSDDWTKIVGNVLKITKPEKVIKDKNVLSQFLKNVAKDKDSGITISEYISSATAYILPDGKTINFRASSNGTRGDDHRYIVSYLEKDFSNGTDGMYYFMDNTGAIRFIPESPAFDIRVAPTSIQLNKIERFVDTFRGGEIGLDLYSNKFGRKGKFYPSGTRGARVKADVLRFYGSGETGMDFLHENIAYKDHIYECILLEAYTASDIDKIYGAKLKDYIEKNYRLEKIYGPDEDQLKEINTIKTAIINKIMAVDPSSDKKYIGSITRWLLEKRPEDLDTQIKEYLNKFKKLLDLNPGKFGNISKEISKGRYSLDQLKILVNNNSELLGKSGGELTIKDKTGDFKIIGQNNNYVCYLVDRWIEGNDNKHFCFTGDVDWCVKYQKEFDGYEPPYYYFLDKSTGKEFALMHINSLQLKDIRDNPLTKNNFLLIKDIIVSILSKTMMPYKNVEYGNSDFDVIIKNTTPEEFNSIFHNVIGDLMSSSLENADMQLLDKLFNSYSSDELWKKTLMVSGESATLHDIKWLVKNHGHIMHELSNVAIKGLLDDFGLDEIELYKDVVQLRGANGDTYNRKNEISKFLITEQYIQNDWTMRVGREDLTALELAVMNRCLGAFEALINLPSTDLNTTGLDSDHGNGVTPLLYIANLSNYEQDIMFNVLVNDPRVDINAYREEFHDEYMGDTVLDRAVHNRVDILISKGAKHYDELPHVLERQGF